MKGARSSSEKERKVHGINQNTMEFYYGSFSHKSASVFNIFFGIILSLDNLLYSIFGN
jgi:hypothetical protein